MRHLREKGYVSVINLDDILVLGESYEDCIEDVRESCKLLESLGFIVNKQKSQLTPSMRRKILGFIFDSGKMVVELPEEKIEKTAQLIEKFNKLNRCVIRKFAALISTLDSCCGAH